VTTATCITLFRLLLIPVFTGLAATYGQSVNDGQPVEWTRIAAIAVFITAAASDFVDGWIARHCHQHSALGAALDPLADKLLMLAAIVTLSVTGWSAQHRFPWWFPTLVLLRDVLSAIGAWLIRRKHGRVLIRPHWTGKVTNAAQIVAIAWIMLRLETPAPIVPTAIAAFFTVYSGMMHLADGLRQYSHGPPADS
jgi:CDP-diacylglycerol--glycerol-3-phosphate 3-phosphatidyltransferase/cardiolipin synthase